MPNETQQRLPAELPDDQYRALLNYAERNGLTFDEAVMRLAEEGLAMAQLGRRLGIKDFERAPR